MLNKIEGIEPPKGLSLMSRTLNFVNALIVSGRGSLNLL